MTGGPEHPSGHEFAPLEGSSPPDPYAPVDYPATAGLPPPVYGSAYPPPPGYGPPPTQPFPPGAPGYGYGGYSGYSAYGGHDPYRPMVPPGVNGKAIAALVTSVAGLLFCGLPSLVGLVLGVIAMRETRSTGQDGWGLALAGTIVGALVLVGYVLYVLLIVGVAASGFSLV